MMRSADAAHSVCTAVTVADVNNRMVQGVPYDATHIGRLTGVGKRTSQSVMRRHVSYSFLRLSQTSRYATLWFRPQTIPRSGIVILEYMKRSA